MEFMKLVERHSRAQGLTSEDICRVSGIDPYTLYNLQHHRVYLTRPMYFALCVALGFAPDTPNVDSILEANRREVGIQSSAIDGTILEESFERVHALERELHTLQVSLDGFAGVREAYAALQVENAALRGELGALRASIREEVAQAERRGALQAQHGVEVSKEALERREASERLAVLMREELLSSVENSGSSVSSPVSVVPNLTVADLM